MSRGIRAATLATAAAVKCLGITDDLYNNDSNYYLVVGQSKRKLQLWNDDSNPIIYQKKKTAHVTALSFPKRGSSFPFSFPEHGFGFVQSVQRYHARSTQLQSAVSSPLRSLCTRGRIFRAGLPWDRLSPSALRTGWVPVRPLRRGGGGGGGGAWDRSRADRPESSGARRQHGRHFIT